MENNILITTETLRSILPAFESNIIEKVNNQYPKAVEPLDDDIPSVFITGTIPTSKENVPGKLEYISKTDNFHAYTYIKLQGNSTLAHPKKNFTINLYIDEKRTNKLNKEFKHWGAHNNFVLKADYIDITHARNVVSAKLWGKIVSSRSDYNSLPEELRKSPNNGAIDGFPVYVYLQGEYQGLYTLTIPKTDWMFGMDTSNSNHVALCAETNDNGNEALRQNPCNFTAPWSGVDGEHWSYEVGSNALDAWRLLQEDITFLDYNPTHLDLQSAIDYYIFQYIILGVDGLAKNMLLLTYDKNKWYLSPYDMDATFDLNYDGHMLNSFNAAIPASNNNYGEPNNPYLNYYSDLWNKLSYYQSKEIQNRYIELRKGVLSKASIISEFENFINTYGEDIYIKDTVSYPYIPSVVENNLQNLKSFISNRLDAVDVLIAREVIE